MANGDSPKKYAADIMAEVAKQLLTLASGFIVVSVALLDVMKPATGQTFAHFWLILLTWAFLVLSLLSGLFALGGIAATAHDKGTFDVDEPVTRFFQRSQQVLFVLSFVSFVLFAAANSAA